MIDDTRIGVGGTGFPQTHWSALRAVSSDYQPDREKALGMIVTAYWKPVYKYIRIQWQKSNEDAKDLTQGFFLRVIEKDFLKPYDPSKARFRTFLRICLTGYVANEEKSSGRKKRGGDVTTFSLDFTDVENELVNSSALHELSTDDPEQFFHNELIRSLFTLSVEDLKKECEANGKTVRFRIFERYDLRDDAKPTYEQLGKELGIATSQVTNHLFSTRKEFRNIVLQRLKSLCSTEEEYRSEAESLFGINPK